MRPKPSSHRIFRLAAGLVCLTTSATTSGDTIDVCPDGSCDFTSVRAAVLAASDGDVIQVFPGDYVLSAGQEIDIFDRSLTIRGVGPVSGIVVQGAAGAGIFDIRGSASDRVVLENLTIFGGATSIGGGVYAENVELVVNACHFEANLADAGGAAATSNAAAEFDSCRFTFNDAVLYGGGVYASGGEVRFVDCLFDDNLSDEGGGIASAFCDMDLVRCRLVDNIAPSGGAMIVAGDGATIPVLVDSLICGSGGAPVAGPIVDSGGSNTFTNFCQTCKGEPDAIATWTDPSSDCNDDGRVDACQISNGQLADINRDGIPDTCQSSLVFEVPSRFDTIASAIDAAPDGSSIDVAAGTYYERLDLGDRDITITGAVDAPETVILDGANTGGSIMRLGGTPSTTPMIQGFTFRNGGDTNPGTLGGAIRSQGGSPLIRDCIFEANRADLGGAIYGTGGDHNIKRCRFVGNQANRKGGAIELKDFGAATLVKDCEFVANRSIDEDGGAIRLRRGEAVLRNCLIEFGEAERGGGLYVSSSGTVAVLDACEIRGNTATTGGGLFLEDGSSVSLAGCTIQTNLPDDIAGSFEDLGGNEIGGEDPPTCPGDFDGNGSVGGSDLGIMLVEYGRDCDPDNPCQADLDGDGTVTGADLGLLLVAWGACP